jgi:hypothetical protein
MTKPGAVRSGFCLPSRVGPRLLNEEIFDGTEFPLVTDFVSKDPTAMMLLAFAGSLIVPASVAVVKNPSDWSM